MPKIDKKAAATASVRLPQRKSAPARKPQKGR
jgi:hypothetical protein